jgi:hypothetical protein
MRSRIEPNALHGQLVLDVQPEHAADVRRRSCRPEATADEVGELT